MGLVAILSSIFIFLSKEKAAIIVALLNPVALVVKAFTGSIVTGIITWNMQHGKEILDDPETVPLIEGGVRRRRTRV